jgi:hypothetical protein
MWPCFETSALCALQELESEFRRCGPQPNAVRQVTGVPQHSLLSAAAEFIQRIVAQQLECLRGFSSSASRCTLGGIQL